MENSKLQSAFDTTSKVLFGAPLGALSDFAPYLSEIMLPCQTARSSVSGKEVMLSSQSYSKGARVASQDELAALKSTPFSPNDIRDIDSLFRAAQERAVFCGNKVFGKSMEVKGVDNCFDCFGVEFSHNVFEVKSGAYLAYQRESECVFGACGFPGSQFSMRVFNGIGAIRCFECYIGRNLSETYYAFNCIGCRDCMFAFNLRGKRHVIGNLELPRERYLELKNKLVAEMGGELRRKKRLFSIADLAFIGREKGGIKADETIVDSPIPPKIEDAFSKTTQLLFGRKRTDIRSHSAWLQRHAMDVKNVKGASGSPTYRMEWLPIAGKIPADRLLPLNEAMDYSEKNHIQIGQGESPALCEVAARAAKIARFSFEFVDGYNENCVDIPSIFTGYDSYKMWDVTESKYSAYCTAATKSEYIFGAHLRVLLSQFCINCFDSTKLNSCFEVDSSYSSRAATFAII